MDIDSGVKLEIWLHDKPQNVAIAIAARTALRVLPVIATEMPPRGGKQRLASFVALASAAFRCNALALIASKYPAHADHFAARYAAATADLHARSAAVPSAAAAAAADSADFAARSAANVGSPAEFAARCAEFANFADGFADNSGAVWAEIGADAETIEAGASTHELLEAPLWPIGRTGPEWARKNWARMNDALAGMDNWQVWLDWYENRLNGRSRGEAFELIFASVPESEWEKGPAAANAWIAARLPKPGDELIRHLHQDAGGAAIRIESGKAQIDSRGLEADFEVAAQPQTQQLLERARARALTARDHVVKLANQYGFEGIASDVEQFTRLMSGDAENLAANISTAWELSVAIGSFIERDDEVKAGRGGMTPQMDAAPREAIDNLIFATAPLLRRFPTARENDEAVLSFKHPRAAMEPAKEVVQTADKRNLLETSTAEILKTAVAAGERGDGFQSQKSRSWLGATGRNIVIGFFMLSCIIAEGSAKKAVEHFYEHSESGKAIDQFLLDKEKEIIELFTDLPPDTRAAIRELLRRLHERNIEPTPSDPTRPV